MHAIGEASRLSGVGIETIRYYEREGVVPRAERSPSGRRLYGPGDISRLRFVRRCRDMGFSIADAREMLALSPEGRAECAAAEEIGRRHLAFIRARIDDLTRLELVVPGHRRQEHRRSRSFLLRNRHLAVSLGWPRPGHGVHRLRLVQHANDALQSIHSTVIHPNKTLCELKS